MEDVKVGRREEEEKYVMDMVYEGTVGHGNKEYVMKWK